MVRKSTLKQPEIGPREPARAPKVVWSAEPPDRCLYPACGGVGTVRQPLDLVPYVPAMVELIGGKAFTVRELIAHAELIGGGGELRAVLKDRERRQIGRALERLIAT